MNIIFYLLHQATWHSAELQGQTPTRLVAFHCQPLGDLYRIHVYLCCLKGLALPVGPCSPGYYCAGGATEARPTDGETGSICPPGTYCGKPVGLLLQNSCNNNLPTRFLSLLVVT